MDINKIQEILPHRYPFLLIDRIIEFVPDESAHAIKCVTINEPFFQGHFPGHPIMPGVLCAAGAAAAKQGGVGLCGGVEGRFKCGEPATKQILCGFCVG